MSSLSEKACTVLEVQCAHGTIHPVDVARQPAQALARDEGFIRTAPLSAVGGLMRADELTTVVHDVDTFLKS